MSVRITCRKERLDLIVRLDRIDCPYQHVHLALVSHELCCCEGQPGETVTGGRWQGLPGSDDPLDGRVVRQVQEQADVLHRTVLLEVLPQN